MLHKISMMSVRMFIMFTSICLYAPHLFCMENLEALRDETLVVARKHIDDAKEDIAALDRQINICTNEKKKQEYRELKESYETRLRSLQANLQKLDNQPNIAQLLEQPEDEINSLVEKSDELEGFVGTFYNNSRGLNSSKTLLGAFRKAIKDFMHHENMRTVTIGTTCFEVGFTYAFIDLIATCLGRTGLTLQQDVKNKDKQTRGHLLALSENILKDIGPAFKLFKENRGPCRSGAQYPLMFTLNTAEAVVNSHQLLAKELFEQNYTNKKSHILLNLYSLEIVARMLAIGEAFFETGGSDDHFFGEKSKWLVSRYNAHFWQLCANILSIARVAVKHLYQTKKVDPLTTSSADADIEEENLHSFYEIEQSEA